MLDSIEEEIESKYRGAKKYVLTFLKWLILSVVIGCVCGAVGTLFFYCVSLAAQVRTEHSWLIYLLPFAGLPIAYAYHIAGLNRDKGTNLVIRSIRSKEVVPLRMAILIFVSTTVTHLFGGSAGREGAALQIGGGIGTKIGQIVHLNEKELHIMTLCGMSAVFSALFGTPLTATVFSIEVVSVGLMHYSALVPCLFSSILAYEIATHAGVGYEIYHLTKLPPQTLLSYGKIIVIGLICALIGVIFCEIMHKTGKLLHFYVRNRYLLVFAGGAMIVLLTLLCGTHDYNGAGGEVIARALEGEADWQAFLLKILFTAITLSCGFKGGEIVPTFFIGSTLGCVIAPLIGLPASFGAALGLIGMFCAVVNCPIASLLLSVELFGAERILLFAIVCAVSYMMSGTYSLYSSQKIVYSKLEPEYINKHAK